MTQTLSPSPSVRVRTQNPLVSAMGWINRVVGAQNLGLVIALIVLIIIIGSRQSEIFFTVRNWLNIGAAVALIGVVAIAQTMVMLSGGLDVAIASTVGLTSVSIAMALRDTNSVPFALLVGVGVGGGLGFINGALITWGRLNPVIATLGTLSAYQGIGFVITNGSAIGVINQDFNAIGGKVWEVPIPLIILLVLAVLFIIFLRHTDIGRNIYAMGGNPIAARLAGINLNRYKLGIYTLSGVIAGVAAIILTARAQSGQPASGSQGLEFQSITAAVLGGTALSGGKGTIVGTLLGVLIIGTLNNGMILMGVQTFWQQVARGLLLIIATLIQIWQTREKSS